MKQIDHAPYRYTVVLEQGTSGERKIDTNGYSPDSAVSRVLNLVDGKEAKNVHVVSSENTHTWYTNVKLLELGRISFDKKED